MAGDASADLSMTWHKFEAYQALMMLTVSDEATRPWLVVHRAEEGGYWAQVPSIPGCATQGENLEELMANMCEAVEGCLAVDVT